LQLLTYPQILSVVLSTILLNLMLSAMTDSSNVREEVSLKVRRKIIAEVFSGQIGRKPVLTHLKFQIPFNISIHLENQLYSALV